ncbi:hypothetical protein ACFW1A_15730 [Kitasatospora sp. NPDC058965]|uniref:hypothetical protein n=1 Tax=Kitasatospora sp. NPDC058965 TaxID=3346682 RepID=UPI0036C120CC
MSTSAAPAWAEEYRLDQLLAEPAVRAVIAAAGVPVVDAVPSAAQFLADFQDLPFIGSAIGRGADRGHRLGLRWGLRAGAERTAEFDEPVGRVLVAALCSLARHRLALRQVTQHTNGCSLEAAIPSDWRTFGGTLTVTALLGATGTAVRVEAEFGGQLYDWGAGKKTVAAFLADLPGLLTAQP